ncbi:CYTH and CHAD domain-containing protein [Streptomyces celluloflavus]|uniref:CYTH and CHAD domain-containing protein n=1 Tax=Streptomyces celluloflavus TaxID=58344 RepID=UPI0036A444EE
MADIVREIERKYAATDETRLPDLTGVDRVAAVVARGVEHLDAVYYDTADQRLAGAGITLRRRTGGRDAGWHLKLPVAPEEGAGTEPGRTRDEVRAPLSDTPPPELTALVRARVLGRELVPVVRLRTRRTVRVLQDAAGAPLAEVAVDAVRAQRTAPAPAKRGGGPAQARWCEIEVELAGAGEGGAALLDAVGRALAAAGIRPAGAASKLARALADTETGTETGTAGGSGDAGRAPGGGKAGRAAGGQGRDAAVGTAGDIVLRYVREQVRVIVELDPAVRRELPDSVHRMRVATRRLRSAFRSYAKVLDRVVTDPLGVELRWLAGELGVARDREVLAARLRAGLAELPRPLRLGPVAARLRGWSRRSHRGARREVLATLDGARYLALLEALDALVDDPPLLKAAARPAPETLARAVRKDYRRLAGRVTAALAAPAGPVRDQALHSARKAAKRTRYAAEAAVPALGRPAETFVRRTKRVQQVLGDHQDSVVARAALRELAVQAHRAGEAGFTFGLLYGREEARAADRERELPDVWRQVSPAGLRARSGA